MTDRESGSEASGTKIDLVRWLIDRHDTLRGGTATRAAIVLTADAVFVSGLCFVLEKIPLGVGLSSIGAWFLGAAIAGLVASILCATGALVGVWRPSTKTTSVESRHRLFFNARSTMDHFVGGGDAFRDDFRSTDSEQMLTYALTELWTAQSLYRQRYRLLRYSIRMLQVSMVPLVIGLIMFIVKK